LAALGFSSDLRLSGFVIFVFLSIAVVGAGTLTAPTLLSRWFVIHRGRAMAIATAGIPLGSVVVVPLMAHTIAILGWRHALIATGLVVGGMLAIMALFVRDAPGPRDVEPGSTEIETFRTTSASAAAVADEGPIAVGQLLKTSRFWAFAIAAALAFGVVSSDILAIVPFAQGLGYSETQAAIIMPIFGMASLAGTLIYGWLGDRASPFGVFAGTCLVLGAANIGLWLAHSLATIDVAVAILGLATGVLTPVYLALIATAFGSSSFGVVSGCASFVSTFVSAGAIRFGGEVFDRTGNYQIMLVTFSVVTLIAAALIALSWRIRPTALVQA
jgi:sugar phosphate permease